MTHKPAPQRENLLVSIIFNVAIPSLLLMKGAKLLGWPPAAILSVALLFPVSYFFYDLKRRGRRNLIAILGFVSTLITGGVGLLQLDKDWIAVKEAAIPALFGIAIVASLFTRRPLVRAFLLNPDFFDVDRIDTAVDERGTRPAFNALLRKGTVLFAASFFLSAVLNYTLARFIVTAESGSELFNEQLGRMQLLSYPVIVVPTMIISIYAFWVVIKGIERDTGLKAEDLMHGMKEEKAAR